MGSTNNNNNNNKQLEALINKVIKVNQGGPNSRVGKLLAVNSDFITLLTKPDGVLYYNLDHVKSFATNVSEETDLEIDELNEVDCHRAESFQSLLNSLKYQWVQINRGPDKAEGVVNEITNELITLVHNKEVIRVYTFHINNISIGNKPKKDKDDNDGDQKDKDDKNKDDKNKDDKNKDDKKSKESEKS
ncbi:hypothetical protein CWR48_16550 [Oceanobacillus arenosus]|uniref:Spore coat protein n=1 Tax=Oceanobacillus arenosus TaxID=1229153 RepID=A0A3D8PMN5_9BACI|nr:hypothetical protein [Oceanobacillus arenosus]RDW16491.1 hypothetical protein CWR48_16550 [Oceanobacillus arenosus]